MKPTLVRLLISSTNQEAQLGLNFVPTMFDWGGINLQLGLVVVEPQVYTLRVFVVPRDKATLIRCANT